MPRPTLAKLALAASAALLASGCSSATVPVGTAAQIGTRSLSNGEVDRITHSLCEAEGPKIKQSNQRIPLSRMRSVVVAALSTRAIVSEIADEYGIKPGESYSRQVSTWRLTSQGMDLSPQAREDYVTWQTWPSYRDDILSQAAEIKMAEAGIKDPSPDDLQAAGIDLLKTWSASNKLEFDPRYGLTVRDGAIDTGDTAVSVPVSDFAKAGQDFDKNPDFGFQLSGNLVCGD